LQPATPIGVICALRREAQLLLGARVDLTQITHLESQVLVNVCGMGSKRAQRAAHALLEAGCKSLVSFGTAGGLQPGLSVGGLVIPERVIDEDGAQYCIDLDWRERLTQTLKDPEMLQPQQVLISVESPVLSSETKYALGQRTGACAVDMESVAIARIAQEKNIPLLVLRAVSDDYRQSLPAELIPVVDPYGDLQAWTLIKVLLLYPQILGRLPGLYRGTQAAERALTRVIRGAGLRFCA
jgi:adenosylhomocysteine nucleosidase